MSVAACPKCGGSKRRPLAPNYFRCESEVEYFTEQEYLDTEPDPYMPHGMRSVRRVVKVRHVRECGNRYQVGGAVGSEGSELVCDCGVFAIGRCKDCEKPLCGDHAAFGDVLLCKPCKRERDRPAREQRIAEEAKKYEALHEHAVSNRERDARAKRDLANMPTATFEDLVTYLAGGREQIDPAEWSLQRGRRLDPVPWETAARAMTQAGIPTCDSVHLGNRKEKGIFPWSKEKWVEVRQLAWMLGGERSVIDARSYLRLRGALAVNGIAKGHNDGGPGEQASRVALFYLARYGDGAVNPKPLPGVAGPYADGLSVPAPSGWGWLFIP